MRIPTLFGCLLGSLALAACSSVPGESSSDDGAGRTTAAASSEVNGESAALLHPVASTVGVAPQEETARSASPQGDVDLQQQVNKVLGRQSRDAAKVLFDRGNLEDAWVEIQKALRFDPGNEEYQQFDRRIRTALGKLGPDKMTMTLEAQKRAEIQEATIRAQAGINLQRSRQAMKVGDYTKARHYALIVLNTIKYAPIGQWDATQADANALLNQANELRQRQLADEQTQLRDEVKGAMEKWKVEIEMRRRGEIASLLQESSRAFDQERYDEALAYAERVLKFDPENEKAQQLSLSSKKLKLDKSRRDYLQAKKRRFRDWRLENEALKIPYTDVLTMPDAGTFLKNMELRKSSFATESPEAEAAKAELRDQLRKILVPGGPAPEGDEPKLKIESLDDLINIVRNNPPVVGGIPVRVLASFATGEDEFGGSGPEISLEFYHDISLLDLMELAMAQANRGVEAGGATFDFQLFPDRIQFVKVGGEEEGAATDAVLRTYAVRDLTFKLNSFTGPDIGTIRLPGSADTGEGPGPYGGLMEDPTSLITGDKLEEYITRTIAPGTWNDTTYKITRGGDDESPTVLLVSHRPEVQRQVAEFLANLKRTTTSLVTIESRFLTISENFLQEFGIDFRGLGGVSGTLANLDDLTNGLEDQSSLGFDNTGSGNSTGAGKHPSSGIFFNDGSDGDLRARTEHIFDNPLGRMLSSNGGATVALTILDDTELSIIMRAVEKFADFRIVNSQTLSVFNTERAYITVVNQISYIQDFDVEVAQASSIADPVVNVLQDGVVLDVRPVITQDRKHIILELRPTVANLLRPLPTFSSTLGGLTIPVTFQLPELQVSSAQTTAVVPDGASILIGGLKTIRNVERRAEVPVLARIPIIGFLGRREGISDETESLMVLIRAYITDVEDALNQHLANH